MMILDLPPQVYEQLTISAKQQGIVLQEFVVKSAFETVSDWQPSANEYALLNALADDDKPNDELSELLKLGASLV